MKLANIWIDDKKLRLAFSWLTRIGATPKFGSVNLATYQRQQVDAIEAIEKGLTLHNLTTDANLRCKNSVIYAQGEKGSAWVSVAQFGYCMVSPIIPD